MSSGDLPPRVTCHRLPPDSTPDPPDSPDPTDFKANADTAHQRGEFETAARLYTLALQQHGPCPNAYGNRSASYAALHEPVRALADAMMMRFHAKEDRQRLKACYRFARALLTCGLRRDALQACEEGLALRPNHPQLLNLIGICTHEKPQSRSPTLARRSALAREGARVDTGAAPEADTGAAPEVALRLRIGRGAPIDVAAPCSHSGNAPFF